ncbi:hypothetical protein SKAU_G00086810 [Synaphobranchus kaupii]|uniref:Reverse transcriptase/retrotransposon-derived protein RNase H-like domain-containing protein n=1 Tax=Synaphobranchus kaupii TaxID=118154 RepID=A0A9Q1FWQ6_SYNKA|nr:hypothetical protein SKAU_G00086810 [Synaphobranchus kaupii]
MQTTTCQGALAQHVFKELCVHVTEAPRIVKPLVDPLFPVTNVEGLLASIGHVAIYLDDLVITALLVHYNPALPLVIAADASPYGLGAVLKPICFASRSLAPAEQVVPLPSAKPYWRSSMTLTQESPDESDRTSIYVVAKARTLSWRTRLSHTRRVNN